MKKLTKLMLTLTLCLLGVGSAAAKTEKVHATFENPSNTNTTWNAETKTFTWSTTYYNQLRNIGLPSGDITKYKKLVVDCDIKSGDQFRILIYKGGSNKTLYASNGVNEFILADTLKVLYPDDYNEFLLACDEICLSGNNNAAPGEAVINDVYLETYDDEGEKVYATFENPSNTNTSWNAETKTFTWSTTYYNQLRNIGLPSGDITKYKKLVVDCDIKSGDQFRILFYKGGSNKTLYASNGVNEFILVDTLKALYPDDYNEFLLACDEICLSGNNNAAPGEAVINSVYLETYPENESVEIPDIVYEEDPGKPAGDFVDFTTVFPNLQPKLGIGTDGHPIKLGNGDVVVGERSKAVIADLSPYTKLTMVTSPNLKVVLYMNHEIDAKQNAGDYTEEDAGKYLFQDLQADENGLIEFDLTQLDKQDLNCICLPWDNSNKGTVWYLLLTEKEGKTIYLNPGIWDVQDANERYAAYMFNGNDLYDWVDFKAIDGAKAPFVATIPARYTGIVLCRMNGETTENNWDNKWNQTDDIKPITNDAVFTITGWGEGDNAKSTYEVNAPEPQPELKEFAVKFINGGKWEKVYAYAWSGKDESKVEFLGNWPGTELTKIATTTINGVEYDAYECTVKAEVAPEFIIFNNGNGGEGNQTDDLKFEDGANYKYNITEEPVKNTYTATFENNGNWAEVYAYAWSGDGEAAVKFLGDWPGTKIEAADGGYVLTFEAEAAPEKIIFNNGGTEQTEDLAFENGKTYTYGKTEPQPVDPDLVEIPQDQGKTLDEFARAELVEGEDYNTYTCSADLQVAFKMYDIDVKDCDYVVVKFAEPVTAGWSIAFWAQGGTKSVEIPAGATEYKYVFADDSECAIKDDVLPQITMLTLWGAEKPLVAKVAGVYKHKVAVPVEDVYTVAGNNANIFGAEWNTTATANDLTKNADGTYSITYKGVALTENVSYKVVKNHAWDEAWPSSDRVIGINMPGTYDVTIHFNPATGKVWETMAVYKEITDAGYATFCAPYALNFEGTGVQAFFAKNDQNDGKLHFYEIFNAPLTTGLLLKAPAGTYKLKMESVEGDAAADVNGNKLIGVRGDSEYISSIYVLLDGDKGVGFYKTTKPFTVKAWTAFIGGEASSREFIALGDETTGIKTVATTKANGEIFNLNGQRVVKAQKGLYIINGKKVLVK